MKLHTVFITYNRLELTKQAIESYLETVSVPFTLAVVDNASTDGTADWIKDFCENTYVIGPQDPYDFYIMPSNVYPGPATNFGWSVAPLDATHLHRADNDFAFLPGWCEEVERIFQADKVGQVGLRTDEEECFARWNVGGNNVIRRELWDQGLRYDERPWPEYPPGYSEDSYFSPSIVQMGYTWTRVKRPCIRSLSQESWDDPYYRDSWEARGMSRPEDSSPATR